jgi:alkanesulfonate monooxygenase SsuD/methylene tetrahydromethanopterin reductase-like flavin-dependent oxidoreductase (luciferase family)
MLSLTLPHVDAWNTWWDDYGNTAEGFAALDDRISAACRDAGRDPASLTYSVALTTYCGRDDAELRRRTDAATIDRLRSRGLVGTPDEIVDRIGRYAEVGASRVYLQVYDVDDLDMIELMAERVLPQLR